VNVCVVPAGDAASIVEFDEVIDPVVNAAATAVSDRVQTAAGYAMWYPKLATANSADISVTGQLGPGDTPSLGVCSQRDAMTALVVRERAWMALEAGGHGRGERSSHE
jgi:hypothetical protein